MQAEATASPNDILRVRKRSRFAAMMFGSTAFRLSVAVWAAIVLAAIFAPLVAPYPPNEFNLGASLQPPSLAHWMGTDQLGRDVLSRVIWGARLSLTIVLSAVVLAGLLGSALGVISGYVGGMTDAVIMRVVEIQSSLPAIILAMVTVGIFGTGTMNLILVITLTNWPRFTRIVRSEAWSLRNRDFVMLAELGGASSLRIVWRHILPNLMPTLIVLFTLDIGLVILLESALSFLGLGVQPPDPSWGTMIADGRGYMEKSWWLMVAPGLALVLAVLTINVIGDRLRLVLSPRLAGEK